MQQLQRDDSANFSPSHFTEMENHFYSCYITISLYVCLLVFNVVTIILHRCINKRIHIQLFHVLLLISITARIVWLALLIAQPDFWLGTQNSPSNQVLPDLITLTCYCTYLFMIVLWAQLYFQAQALSGKSNTKLTSARRIQRWLTLLFFGTTTVLFVFLAVVEYIFSSYDLKLAHSITVKIIFFPVMGLTTAICFIFFGSKLYTALLTWKGQDAAIDSQLKKIGLLTAICTATFSLRSMCAIVLNQIDLSGARLLVMMLFYCIFELVPSLLVLLTLRVFNQASTQTNEDYTSVWTSPSRHESIETPILAVKSSYSIQ